MDRKNTMGVNLFWKNAYKKYRQNLDITSLVTAISYIFKKCSTRHAKLRWLSVSGDLRLYTSTRRNDVTFGLLQHAHAFLEIRSIRHSFLVKTHRFGQSRGSKILKSREKAKKNNNNNIFNIVTFKFHGVPLVCLRFFSGPKVHPQVSNEGLCSILLLILPVITRLAWEEGNWYFPDGGPGGIMSRKWSRMLVRKFNLNP